MRRNCATWLLAGALAGLFLLASASDSSAQYRRRYEPSRPTMSPYLNLFRFNNTNVPNYYSWVRPMQQERAFQQEQERLSQRQSQAINQLQSNLQVLQQGPVTTTLVAPTGKNSWFNRQGGSTFLDSSRYFSQSGGGGGGPRR